MVARRWFVAGARRRVDDGEVTATGAHRAQHRRVVSARQAVVRTSPDRVEPGDESPVDELAQGGVHGAGGHVGDLADEVVHEDGLVARGERGEDREACLGGAMVVAGQLVASELGG